MLVVLMCHYQCGFCFLYTSPSKEVSLSYEYIIASMFPVCSTLHIIKGGGDHIVACTSTHDRSQDFDPTNFYAWLTHWLHQKFGLDPWLFSTINHLESLWRYPQFLYHDCLTSFKIHLDRLSSLWPQSWVGVHAVAYVVCVPPPCIMQKGERHGYLYCNSLRWLKLLWVY